MSTTKCNTYPRERGRCLARAFCNGLASRCFCAPVWFWCLLQLLAVQLRAAEWTENWLRLENGVEMHMQPGIGLVGGFISVPSGQGLLTVTITAPQYVVVRTGLPSPSGSFAVLSRLGAAPSGKYRAGTLEPDPGVIAGTRGQPLRLQNPPAGDYFVAAYSYSDIEKLTEYSLKAAYVAMAPRIAVQPQSQQVLVGNPVTFTVVAEGQHLTYQWQHDGRDVPGATGPSLTIPAVQPADAGDYRVVVRNPGGEQRSGNAVLTVLLAPKILAPEITRHPESREIRAGETVTLTVEATGTPPLSYQWYLGASGDTRLPIDGAETPSYRTPPLENDAAYWVRVSNSAGSVDSDAADILTADGALRLWGRWPGYRQGPALNVTVSGDYAYLAGAGVHVIDISDPAQPRRIGGFHETLGNVNAVAIRAGYAYLADDWQGLRVLDMSIPGQLRSMGLSHGPSGMTARGVVVQGTYAYLTEGNGGGFWVLDITDPSNLWTVAGFEMQEEGWDLALAGDHVVVAFQSSDGPGLLVVDVAEPAEPRVLGRVDQPGLQKSAAVAVSANRAYLASGEFSIIDLADPGSPWMYDGTLTAETDARDVAIRGSTAFVAAHSHGLQVLDVSNPDFSHIVGAAATSGNALGLTVSGDLAFVAAEWGGLDVVDVADPTNPRRVGTVDPSGEARGVAVRGDYVYLADGDLQVLDVSDAANPVRVGGFDTPGYAGMVTLSGDYAYVTDDRAGLHILDIRSPAAPNPVANLLLFARDLAFVGNYALVTDRDLIVVDVSDPASPKVIAGLDTKGSAEGIAVAGNHAFVAVAWEGLEVVDISDPARPRRVASLDTSGDARGVAVLGDYAFVADYRAGLQVIEVRDPLNPRHVAQLPTRGVARDIVMFGHYACVAGDHGGVKIVDVAIPSAPRLVAGQDTPGTVFAVATDGFRMFAASGEMGLEINEFVPRGDSAPRIARQPAAQRVTEGEGAQFNVEASGTLPLAYQWRKDGYPLEGATASALNLSAVTADDAGGYDVVVTNEVGSVTSVVAQLTVERIRLLPTWAEGRLSLEWSGTARLQRTDDLSGPWQDVPDARSPYEIVPEAGNRFFRLQIE